VNVGFAKLQMLSDLRFSETVYAWAPAFSSSDTSSSKSRATSSCTASGRAVDRARDADLGGDLGRDAVRDFGDGILHPALSPGCRGGGFFPGVILYLTYWYPSDRRAAIIALFMTGIPVAG